MNREIKFRAKGVDGEWWYGETNPVRSNYRHINLATFFANLQVGQILVESLGDYTGLHDKKRVEIYEGDIVAFDREGKDYWRELYEIKYSPYRACWQLFLLKRANHTDSPQYISNHFTQGEADTIEVIGNI